jgi:hypothetical protein
VRYRAERIESITVVRALPPERLLAIARKLSRLPADSSTSNRALVLRAIVSKQLRIPIPCLVSQGLAADVADPFVCRACRAFKSLDSHHAAVRPGQSRT